MRGYQDRPPSTPSRDAGQADMGHPSGSQMDRGGPTKADMNHPSTRDSAFTGAGSGRQDQMASNRGQTSRQEGFHASHDLRTKGFSLI